MSDSDNSNIIDNSSLKISLRLETYRLKYLALARRRALKIQPNPDDKKSDQIQPKLAQDPSNETFPLSAVSSSPLASYDPNDGQIMSFSLSARAR